MRRDVTEGDLIQGGRDARVARREGRAVLDVARRAGDVGTVDDRREARPRAIRGRSVTRPDLERDPGARRGGCRTVERAPIDGDPASWTREVNVPPAGYGLIRIQSIASEPEGLNRSPRDGGSR